jgi:tetratricopeptide (TPR) repeat protein
MKRLIYTVLGIVVVGLGIGLFANRSGSSAPPVANTLPSPTIEDTPPATRTAARPAQPRRVSIRVAGSSQPSALAPAVPTETAADDSGAFKQAIETLLSTQSSYPQKQEAWKQLRDLGKLDQAIAELEQRVSGNPQVADYSATLGRAYLEKAGTITDVRQQGILGMKADLAFDEALKTDPNNWEARFTKAVALSYWPPQLNKGQEVIDHFTQLVNQQEAQPPQPQFAQTYVWLGDQYQKAGNADYARQIWERGAALYPNDATLPKRLTQPAGQ